MDDKEKKEIDSQRNKLKEGKKGREIDRHTIRDKQTKRLIEETQINRQTETQTEIQTEGKTNRKRQIE